MDRLRIAEIFCSIQGEGAWVGTPSVFVRISGCSLRCVWCDSRYASWEPEGPVIGLGDILNQVVSYGVRDVVITGGEPMIFEPITRLTEALRDRGHRITIETAGIALQDVHCDLMSISPKLSNSTPAADPHWAPFHEAKRRQPSVVRELIEAYPYQLKFVVSEASVQKDLAEIDQLVNEIGVIDPSRIYLMPEGTNSEVIHRGARALAPLCIARGWNLSPRLHIDLFGDTRGT